MLPYEQQRYLGNEQGTERSRKKRTGEQNKINFASANKQTSRKQTGAGQRNRSPRAEGAADFCGYQAGCNKACGEAATKQPGLTKREILFRPDKRCNWSQAIQYERKVDEQQVGDPGRRGSLQALTGDTVI